MCHSSKFPTNINFIIPQNSSVTWVLLLPPFCRWRAWCAEKANSLPQVRQLVKEESHLSLGIRAPQSILVDLVLCWIRRSLCSRGIQSLKGQMCVDKCVHTACRMCGERINSNFSKGSQLAGSRTRIRLESSEFELQSQCVLHFIGQACIWWEFGTDSEKTMHLEEHSLWTNG